MINWKTDYIKRISRKIKSKKGTTLVEMIATVAILSIVASLSLQALVMAREENRRVDNVSVAQRSISLLQENFNKYLRNAIKIEMIDTDITYSGCNTVEDALREFVMSRTDVSTPEEDRLADAEATTDPDEYNDYFLYRSGTFSYTLAKFRKSYTAADGTIKTNAIVPIFEVSNIKEIQFSLKALEGTKIGTDTYYVLDYVATAPTNEELVMTKSKSDEGFIPGNWTSNSEFISVMQNNLDKSLYSINSGTILNNMYGSGGSGTASLKISEGLKDETTFDTTFKNFVFIRTLPKADV